jgi:hypothetical protein
MQWFVTPLLAVLETAINKPGAAKYQATPSLFGKVLHMDVNRDLEKGSRSCGSCASCNAKKKQNSMHTYHGSGVSLARLLQAVLLRSWVKPAYLY